MFNFFTLIKNYFQFYFRKEGGNIFFQFSLPKMFFGKLNFFSKKTKICDKRKKKIKKKKTKKNCDILS